jgi:CRP/FNR family transcriptional regulator, cyclic AMP receptor protein
MPMREEESLSDSRMKDAITELLAMFSFFDSLDEKDLSLISRHLHITELEPGKILFKEGDKGDCVYFVLDGELDVLKEAVSGRKAGLDRVMITTLIKGKSIGEMSVIDRTPRSATVEARTKATLVGMTLEGFDFICEEHPRIGIKILKGISRLLSMNMRKTSSRLVDYMLPVT